jgi:hypothetical protein
MALAFARHANWDGDKKLALEWRDQIVDPHLREVMAGEIGGNP